ncbi:WxL domain-containing protein [Carnobacterium divergens]|uniref:WxL domain-containing protein n=1 Tax=Carnobacterium divergens TaxID=2748 RepID=A0A7Z8D060_CARDV|nr:WxL domain-containing protein [Carnobacterium divergens]TFI74465.1 hypothetical protein CKN58_04365 [Carnobacterium divergens]TFI78787.1 hypothetical protein CKN85_04360 [Carnobacterium divergens]TFI85346.1 hypothetical protein CKN56_04335 [Carnobacterium divergens]TFI97702.1 hypothetical protein CKN64_04335 [Carnobacterium divergens]TFJ13962.1 hypothetical protein CKN60_04405 [Carnobacterium divergens]
MKKSIVFFTSTLTLLSVFSSATVFATEDEERVDRSIGELTFKKKDSITNPTDPEENSESEQEEYIPQPPKQGIPGELTIVYATDLKFPTVEVSGNNATYHALLAEAKLVNKETKVERIEKRANYVEINDGRGSNAGWTLMATQNGQFATENGKPLEHASLSFSNIGFNSKNLLENGSTTPLKGGITTRLDPTGENSTLIASAADGQGMGSWHILFGQRDLTNPEDLQAGTAGEAVSLFVPGTSAKVLETYRTSITWTIAAAP